MKIARQAKIKELIQKYNIKTQKELISRLKIAGYDVTQATVSRDIRDLCLVKASQNEGVSFYKLPGDNGGFSPTYLNILKSGFVSMNTAGNILVIKTISGMAEGMGTAIDSLRYDEIAGSLAGDDTILVIVKDAELTNVISKRIRKLIGQI